MLTNACTCTHTHTRTHTHTHTHTHVQEMEDAHSHTRTHTHAQEMEEIDMEGGGGVGGKRTWSAALGGAGTSAGTGGTKRQRAARCVSSFLRACVGVGGGVWVCAAVWVLCGWLLLRSLNGVLAVK